MLESIQNLTHRKRIIFDSGIILLASILVCLPIILNGVPATQDIPQQYQFAQNFYDSIMNGTLYPSWADQPNLGYGDVSVRFYPPLTYYILSFFRYLTGNWFDASCLFFISLYFLSGLGVYSFCKQYFSSTASLIAGITYIWLPYHVMQIYLGGVFAEFTAAAIIPFCLLFINRVCKKGRLIDMCGLTFTFALILLTHLPTSVFASLTFFIYSLFTIERKNFLSSVFKLGASVSFSVLLSSFYLVRMITEFDWVKHSGDAFSTGDYSYKTQFVFSYFFPFLEIKHASATAGFNIISLLTIGILLPGIVYCYREKIFSLKNIVVITFLGLFMASPMSLIIWDLFQLLQKIQFPFRWLTIFTLGAAILSAASFSLAIEYFKTPKRYLSLLLVGVSLLTITFNYNSLMSSDITFPRFFLNNITARFKTMPSYECWWTNWAQKSKTNEKRPEFIADKIDSGNRKFEIKKWSATERIFTVNEGESTQILVATLYYPHWKATVNGNPVEITPNEGGLISIPLSNEKSEVHIFFQEPLHVMRAFYISGFAWIIFLVLFFYSTKKSTKLNL
ncbi:MAG: 6-pyruvoyl-tetrahydropterin synthase-related protein [Acidobacteriota bacterium]